MKNFIWPLLFAAASAGGVVGCAHDGRTPPPPLSPDRIADKENNAAVTLGEKLIAAIKSGDYPAFAGLIRNSPLESLNEKDFNTSRNNLERQFGALENANLLASLETPAMENLIWVVTFERKGSDGKTIRQQLLFRLVAAFDAENKVHPVGFGFL